MWPQASLFTSLSISVETVAFSNVFFRENLGQIIKVHQYPFVTDSIIIFIILLFAQDYFSWSNSYSSEHFLLIKSLDLTLFMTNITIH